MGVPNRPQKWRDLAILIILDTLFVIQLAAIAELEIVKVWSPQGNPSKSSCFEWFLIGFAAIFVQQENKNNFYWIDYAHWISSEMTSNRFLQSKQPISRCVAFLFFWFSVLYSQNLDFTVLRSCTFFVFCHIVKEWHDLKTEKSKFWEYKTENQKNKNATHLEIGCLDCRNRLEVISLLIQWA